MKDELNLKDLKLNINGLLDIGFVEESEYYKYETTIINNQFHLIIKIEKNGVIVSDCFEIST